MATVRQYYIVTNAHVELANNALCGFPAFQYLGVSLKHNRKALFSIFFEVLAMTAKAM